MAQYHAQFIQCQRIAAAAAAVNPTTIGAEGDAFSACMGQP
jgi:hypothetical protein